MIRRAFLRSVAGAVAAIAATPGCRPGRAGGMPLEDISNHARAAGSALYLDCGHGRRFQHFATFRHPDGYLQEIRWDGSHETMVSIGGYTLVSHHIRTTVDQHLDLVEWGI